jgi:hypothetical protein
MNEPWTTPDDQILARVGALTDRFVDYARQGGSNVARGLETGELAALLCPVCRGCSLMVLNEIYDLPPHACLTASPRDSQMNAWGS